MPAAATKVSREVAARARGLNAYVGRMEKLFGTKAISRVDINRTYAGACLGFCTYAERSLERLFLGLLMRRFVHEAAAVQPLVDIRSDRVARAVVNGGRKYVDWLPYDQFTEPRAEAFLSRGLPFTAMNKDDRKALQRLFVLRNAIAHESKHSLRQFHAHFTDGKALSGDQLTPAGYLRGRHSADQTRFSYTLAEAVDIFRRLCGGQITSGV